MYLAGYIQNKFEIYSSIYSGQYSANKIEMYLVAYPVNMPRDTFQIYSSNMRLDTSKIHVEYMRNIRITH